HDTNLGSRDMAGVNRQGRQIAVVEARADDLAQDITFSTHVDEDPGELLFYYQKSLLRGHGLAFFVLFVLYVANQTLAGGKAIDQLRFPEFLVHQSHQLVDSCKRSPLPAGVRWTHDADVDARGLLAAGPDIRTRPDEHPHGRQEMSQNPGRSGFGERFD